MVRDKDEVHQSYEVFSLSPEVPDGIPILDRIVDEKNYLDILISYDDGKKFSLKIFDPIAYRKCEERFLISTLQDMEGVLGNFSIFIRNSEFVKWVGEESLETCLDINMNHTRLLFFEDIIDIITAEDFKFSIESI